MARAKPKLDWLEAAREAINQDPDYRKLGSTDVVLGLALGDETRLRIVALLSHGELCVCHIESALEVSQPNASRQLAVLKAAGLVASRRQGNRIYYGWVKQSQAACRRALRSIKALSDHAQLRDDLDRLTSVKGPKASCR